MQKNLFIVSGILLAGISGALGKKEPAVPAPMSTQKQLALVRVNVTGQSYDYFRPWQKKSAVFEACTRRCFVERPCPGDRGPGCESKLRGVGTRRVWRKNRGQGRGD